MVLLKIIQVNRFYAIYIDFSKNFLLTLIPYTVILKKGMMIIRWVTKPVNICKSVDVDKHVK